jgi:pilus assembly protein Flp/PilA
MNALLRRLRRRSRSAGQGLVEYALILALIAIVVVGSLKLLGSSTNQKFDQVNCTMEGKTWQTDSGNQNSGRCR